MVRLVTAKNKHRYDALLRNMYIARKHVFVDLLRWDVPHDGEQEIDQFDDEFAEYLILSDPVTDEHQASMRLLRTDRPHILGSLFPALCDGEIPVDQDIREVTRLCISPTLPARQRLIARNTLIHAMVDYARIAGIRAFTGVAETKWLTQILSAGWDCRPLGLPKRIDGSMLGGLIIHIEPNTLDRFVDSWRCDAPASRLIETDQPLAA